MPSALLPAPLPRRALAAVFDYALFSVSATAWLLLVGTHLDERGHLIQEPPALRALVALAIWLLVFGVTEAGNGRTIGKMLFGLRVVRESGEPVTLALAAWRHLFDVVELLPLGIPALLAARRSPLGQRWGDRRAGTVVVSTRKQTKQPDNG